MMMKFKRTNFVLITNVLVAVALSGCSLAPRYERPASPVANNIGNLPQDISTDQQLQTTWRSFVSSDQLRKLIETSLENNRDLRTSMLNVDLARTTYRIQQAERWPGVDAVAENNRQRTPANLSSTGSAQVTESARAGLAFSSFEVDLFGRLASLSTAAQEDYFSVAANAELARLLLITEVTNNYIRYNGKLLQKNIAINTLDAREKALALVALKRNNGAANALEYQDALGLREGAMAEMQRLTREVEQSRTTLQLLVGIKEVADLLPTEPEAGNILNASLLGNLPSDILLSRPDVRAAEHQLKARNADIGAARAAFLPRLTLTGFYGSASTEFSDIFKSNQESWSFTPQVSLPIFHAGKYRANVKAAELRENIEVAKYEASIQNAFKDVSDALVAVGTTTAEADALNNQSQAALETQKLVEMRYQAGIDDQLRYLDAQRSAWAIQIGAIESNSAKEIAQTSLFKALGGQWISGNNSYAKN